MGEQPDEQPVTEVEDADVPEVENPVERDTEPADEKE
jgi:hypothetical protein